VETAVLDACVLFEGGVRDFLLWVAEAGAFSPAWSDLIHEEWMRSRHEKFGDSASRSEYARTEMEKAFPGANFAPDPDILATVTLPDMNDVHVVATAVAAQPQTIITHATSPVPFSTRSGCATKHRMRSARVLSSRPRLMWSRARETTAPA
jgi:hypothetical protein